MQEKNKIKKIKIIKNIVKLLFILALISGLIFLIHDLGKPFSQMIKMQNIEPLTQRFQEYEFWGPLLIGLTQMFVILLSVFSSEPIQVIAIINYRLLGILVLIGGIWLGNTIIFLISKHLGDAAKDLFDKKPEEEEEITRLLTSKRASFFIFILYFIPGIPYGLIAATAANTKMKFRRFTIITTLGALPSLIYSTLFSKFIIKGNFLVSLIIFAAVLLLTIIFIFNKKKILKRLATVKEKPTYDMNFFQNNVIKPRFFLYSFVALFARIYFFLKFGVKIKKMKGYKKPKGSFVILYNHPSKFDYVYSFLPLYPTRVNAIIAYYYFCNYKFGKFLHFMGGFPKYLYQPDISSIKNIKRVIKNNWVFGMAPEGRLSAYGALEGINMPTMKLLKNLNVPVVLANVKGAYMSTPKWAHTARRGKIEVHFENLFTVEEVKNISIEDMYHVLMEKLNYDDFKWQEEKHIKYKGKRFAEGLEDILYICPVCHQEYTYSSNENMISCSHCHTQVLLNHYYQFESKNKQIPSNIRDWYLFQKEFEKQRIQDPNYSFTSRVTLKLPDPEGKGFVEVGNGTTTLTHQGITYYGTIHGEEKEIFYKIENLPAILFGVRENFEIYHHNTLYYFVPENLRECVKWSVATEQIYDKYITDNQIDLIK